MTTVLYLFELKPDRDPSDYEQWATSIDIPALRRLPSVLAYRILRTGPAEPSPDGPAGRPRYVEIVDVTSVKQFHADMAAPVLADVTAAFSRFAATPTVLIADELAPPSPLRAPHA